MVILMIARFWTAHYPWSAHYPLAIKQGISAEVLSQIAAGKRPHGLQPEEAVVHDFIASLLEKKGVTDAAFAAVVDNFPPLEGPAPPLHPLA